MPPRETCKIKVLEGPKNVSGGILSGMISMTAGPGASARNMSAIWRHRVPRSSRRGWSIRSVGSKTSRIELADADRPQVRVKLLTRGKASANNTMVKGVGLSPDFNLHLPYFLMLISLYHRSTHASKAFKRSKAREKRPFVGRGKPSAATATQWIEPNAWCPRRKISSMPILMVYWEASGVTRRTLCEMMGDGRQAEPGMHRLLVY
jgi:hypothetical protein